MSEASLPLVEALAAAARLMNTTSTTDEALDLIVHAAQNSLAGIDHVGVSVVHKDGLITTEAATDDLVRQVDALQYELREGPCVSAITTQTPVVAIERGHKQDVWPRYVAASERLGVRSQLGLLLFADHRTLGALNLYSTSTDVLDPEIVHLAELFAAHAAMAMGKVRTVEQLHEGMHARQIIGQAVGILMERHDLTEDRAFAFLSRASQTSNIKLRDIAQELVTSAQARGEQALTHDLLARPKRS
jgi:GAF domain-containing protein